MNLILFIIIIFLHTKFVSNDHLTLFYSATRFKSKLKGPDSLYKRLVCISDSPRDAVIINTELIENDPNSSENDEIIHVPLISSDLDDNERKCETNLTSSECFFTFNLNGTEWSLVSSITVPMGPVYDSRWESFKDIKSDDFLHIVEKDFLIANIDEDAIVFSIRGTEGAQLLLCESENFTNDFCYWLIIGGWENKISIIRKCEYGLFESNSTASIDCWTTQVEYLHDVVNPYEWKTFILTWEKDIQSLKLFNPNKMILKYTDNNYTTKNYKRHIFYKNISTEMFIRFHWYKYILTRKTGAIIKSPLLFKRPDNLCFEMVVGLCEHCQLNMSIIDTLGNLKLTKMITRSSIYKEIEHNLPMWQHEKIRILSSSNETISLTLVLVTISSLNDTNARNNHWAISSIKECLPEGTIKTVLLEARTNSEDSDDYLWSDVACQQLSYNYPNSEVVRSYSNLTDPPDNLRLCPNFKFGPHCEIDCNSYFRSDCKTVVECKNNNCYCYNGYLSATCSTLCKAGSYGYACKNRCNNCESNDCNPFDGECASGCKYNETHFFLPPFCNKVIDPLNVPIMEEITHSGVRACFHRTDNYKSFDETVRFEITQISDNKVILSIDGLAIRINETKTNDYCAVFTNLPFETQFSIRVIMNMTYKNNRSRTMLGQGAIFKTLPEPIKAPERLTVKTEGKGKVTVTWHGYSRTSKLVQTFSIHWKTISTQLARNINMEDEEVTRTFMLYDKIYKLELNLLPSTHYQISIQVVDNEKRGPWSTIEFETEAAIAFEYEPILFPSNKRSEVEIIIPPIVNNIKDSTLYVIVHGNSICMQGRTLNQRLKRITSLYDPQTAWVAAFFPTHKVLKKSFFIGDDLIYNDVTSNCPLHRGESYIIFIVVFNKKQSKMNQEFMWKSQLISIGPIKTHPEYWAFSLVLIIPAIIAFFYFRLKKNVRFRNK